MTPNRAQLGAAPSPDRGYVVTLDDTLSPALVHRSERHYASPALGADDAVALASALTSTVVTTNGWWILPAAGGQSIVVLREA
jgi:hypothetical protein